MFRKLVSHLSFSPSLISELSLYAAHLKKEELTRCLTIFFLLLALLIQSFIVFHPAESANAASSNDLIYGGVTSQADLIDRFDRNENGLRDIYTSFGITRQEIVNTKNSSFSSKEIASVTGRNPHFSDALGERKYTYKKSEGGTASVYAMPTRLFDTSAYSKQHGSYYPAFVGSSDKAGTFAVVKASGNLALEQLRMTGDAINTSQLLSTSSARNIAQGKDAVSAQANASDRIDYTLTIKNTGNQATKATLSQQLSDVLEYSDLVDADGGTFNLASKVLSWPQVSLDAQSTVSHTYSVRVKSDIPATARGQSDPTSYDCIMTNTFGDTIAVALSCPPLKLAEAASSELPPTNGVSQIAFLGTLTLLSIYLYARTRQQREELRLIRHDVNTGVL